MNQRLRAIIVTAAVGLILCLTGAFIIEVQNRSMDLTHFAFTVITALTAGVVIIGFFQPEKLSDQKPAKESGAQPTSHRTDQPGDMQVGIGVMILCVSLIVGVFTFVNYDTSSPTDSSVYNLARGNEKMALLIGSGFGVLVGVLSIGFGQMRQRRETPPDAMPPRPPPAKDEEETPDIIPHVRSFGSPPVVKPGEMKRGLSRS